MEATLVSPGIFPPIISTTPNSPIVCAKERITPVKREALQLGNNTLNKVVVLDFPMSREASLKEVGKLVKQNGRFD